MVRSRVQWLDEGEKPTTFFCALENSNYINKTIKTINLGNQNLVTDQNGILTAVRNFYKDLFKSRDDTLHDINLTDLFKNTHVEKLNQIETDSLEGPLTITELSNTLSNMKNNKTPGIDGFPAYFYKFVLRSINQCYETGELSTTMKQAIISCLPKGDKPREFLKNWRPISLLNVTYKLASGSIAARLKNILGKIISNTQTGFLSNRFIGESTRLIYDIMNFCENDNKTGLLMLIDFEKAFDSVSWKFIENTLRFLNFGNSFRSWINLLNNNISASVTQCGHLSDFFTIERGCRQGDPIAPYLFIICGQILYMMIDSNSDIKGIEIDGTEYKLTQFADDTTLLLDGTEGSLQSALNTLEIFGSYSGLRMNRDKTRVIWIGRKKISRDKLNTVPQLQWGHSAFDLLGIKFSVNLKEMTELNYNKYIQQSIEIANHWSKRYLTPLGKITVIKTFILSKFIHLFSALPNPPVNIVNKINNVMFKFLWNNKPDKLKRVQITKPIHKAALK